MDIHHFTPLFAVMQPGAQLMLRIVGIMGFLAMIPLGWVLIKNQDRWFGRSSDSPNETSGSLGYGKLQSWLAYLGVLHLFLWLATGL